VIYSTWIDLYELLTICEIIMVIIIWSLYNMTIFYEIEEIESGGYGIVDNAKYKQHLHNVN